MPDRIPHDHPSIESIRVRVARHGGRRRRLEVPAEIVPIADVVRIVLDERTRYGRPQHGSADEAWITGVYPSPDMARKPEGHESVLDEWLGERGIDPGATVQLDVIEPDEQYGLREAGTSAVYRPFSPPSSSLASIARDLEEEN